MQRLKKYRALKNLSLFVAAGLLSALIAFFLKELPEIERVENILYDWRVKSFNYTEKINPDIKQIVIDQQSLEWMSNENGLGWPWPREIYAHIIAFLKAGGAKAVVFDLLYTEPSVYGERDDEAFGSALKEMESVGAVVLRHDGLLTKSTPLIHDAFSQVGSVNAQVDSDGVIRRVLLRLSVGDGGLPTLANAVYEILEDTQKSGERIINYRGGEFTFDSYNAAEILASKIALDGGEEPKIAPAKFADSVVFIGLSASGLHDLKPTPIAADFPGVEIHATILDNLLHDDFIELESDGVELLWAVLFSLALVFILYKSERISIIVTLFIFAPLLVFGISILYHLQAIWLNSALLLLAVFLSLILSSILKYLLEGRQKSYIKSAFGKYISPVVVEQLIKNPDMLKLGGEERELSIFFSDIAGFTTISEKLDPPVLISMLNHYLDSLTKIILKHQGTIDKYEGDAIIAFWNAPVLQENHASLALRASIECQKMVAELNTIFDEEYGVSLSTRIGIHTGRVIVGNIGSSLRFDYSFIGDAGNFASRLEGINKVFGTKILISEDMKRRLKGDFGLREISIIKAVGKAKPVRVFEPCSYLEEREKEKFQEAVELFYRQELKACREIFENLQEIDPVSKKYLEIIALIEEGEMCWDEGLVMTSK